MGIKFGTKTGLIFETMVQNWELAVLSRYFGLVGEEKSCENSDRKKQVLFCIGADIRKEKGGAYCYETKTKKVWNHCDSNISVFKHRSRGGGRKR